SEEAPVFITGIGASAGGLEALEEFFRHTPTDAGTGFVVVTHMDPKHKSLLPEILQRYTEMPVSQAETGMAVKPNSVYITPPNTYISIRKGTLTLQEPTLMRGIRMPIDFFFRHLAADRDSRAIGIILSGMGHDGVLGLRALRERMGTVMAQDPASAQFPSMPQSAITYGIVDYIAPAGELPDMLVNYVKSFSSITEEGMDPKTFGGALSRIFTLIRAQTGESLSMFKGDLLEKHIERRMSLHNIEKLDDYLEYIERHTTEIEALGKEIPLGPTRFFRNPEAWDTFRDKALSDIIKSKNEGSVLRVWVSGCASGEEAYSMAIILQEAIETHRKDGSLNYQVFATDIDKDAINRARDGKYIANIESDVSPDRLERFFTKEDNTYTVRPEIRERMVFAHHNIFTHPPFTHL
ncbi:MAG TPA: chemotaxis protein CheB, partial [Methanomicrobiales archaeon]|nr:chemotaxis protein CheB [Methanomicrobiales archaeon]